jgi:hypothetical protein
LSSLLIDDAAQEEKEQLQRQVRELQARLEVEMAHRFGQGTDAEQERGRECTVQLAQNRRLRRELVAQQNRFASAHALLGEYIFTVRVPPLARGEE